MAPKKGLLLALTPDDDEPKEDEEMDDESDEGDSAPTEDQLDAAAALREALSGDDDAAIVDAFKAIKMACGGGY